MLPLLVGISILSMTTSYWRFFNLPLSIITDHNLPTGYNIFKSKILNIWFSLFEADTLTLWKPGFLHYHHWKKCWKKNLLLEEKKKTTTTICTYSEGQHVHTCTNACNTVMSYKILGKKRSEDGLLILNFRKLKTKKYISSYIFGGKGLEV